LIPVAYQSEGACPMEPKLSEDAFPPTFNRPVPQKIHVQD
jgi:hypothetical protein